MRRVGAMEREAIVVARDLVKVYGDGAEVRALDGLTMTVEGGSSSP